MIIINFITLTIIIIIVVVVVVVVVVYNPSLWERDKSDCGKNEICIVDIRTNNARCSCKDGYTGKPCGK